jgi:RHS repeat-associated protein
MPRTSQSGLSDPRHVGDPVDTLTGAVFDRKFEFRLTGPLELWWYRQYNSSQSHRAFALGWGHTHEYDRVLTITDGGLVYEGPVGLTVTFPRREGNEVMRDGFLLRRVTSRRYQLFHHGESAMEFNFVPATASARLSRLFDEAGEILFEYVKGRLTQIVDSARRVVEVVERDDGRLSRLKLTRDGGEPSRLLMAYDYDDAGSLIATRNYWGHGHKFAYDTSRRLIQITGRKGFQFHFSYDDLGRCVSATGDHGLYGVTLAYNVPGRLTKVRRADGGEWSYIFDGTGKLTQIHDPIGGVRRFVHDLQGRVILELDPNSNPTRLAYDTAGAAVERVSPLGHRRALPLDPNAPDPFAHRIPANSLEYEYGRQIDVDSITLPQHSSIQTLALSSEVLELVTPRNERDLLADGSPWTVRPLGVRWWPEPKGGRIFNALGKLVRQGDDSGRLRSWRYDAAGNPDEFVDYDGRRWSYDYGTWHLLRTLTNPLGAAVRFDYTTNGDVASVIDAEGARSDYKYDLKGQLVQVIRHNVVRETYTRDAVGNLLAKHGADGRELLRFVFGAGNLPLSRKLASGDEHTFEYDKSGREVGAATSKDRIQCAYDRWGNRVLEKRNGAGVVQHFEGWAHLTELVAFDRFATTYLRPSSDLLVVIDPGGAAQQIRVLPHGLAERRFSNGSVETVQYDNLGRCLFKHVKRRSLESWRRRYHWSGEGELRGIEDDAFGDVRHEYDAAHRLRARHVRGRRQRFDLDLADNLIAQPGLGRVVLEQGNRLKSANDASYEYNDRNHVAAQRTPRGIVRYHYDSRDQLIRVESSGGVWSADYDAFGRRTRKIWAGKTVEYYWSSDKLAAEVHSDGRMRLYVYADTLAATPILFLDYDSVDAHPESCRRYFVFADQVGAPTVIEDSSGVVVWQGRMAPYGNLELSPKSTISCDLRFPGHYYDAELGLHYNRFRYFDPRTARYLQSDPWGLAGGVNLYAYSTNPLLKVDLRGLGEEKEEPPADDPKKVTGDDEKPLPVVTREAADEARKLGKDERPAVMTGMRTPDGETTTGGSYRGPREEYKGLEGAPQTQAAYDKAAAEVRPPAGTDPPDFPKPEQSGKCGEAQRMAEHERRTGEMPPPGTEFHSDKVGGPNSPTHGEDKAACPYCSSVMDDKGYESSSGTTPYDRAPPAAGTASDSGAPPSSGGQPPPSSGGTDGGSGASPPSGGGS